MESDVYIVYKLLHFKLKIYRERKNKALKIYYKFKIIMKVNQ